MMKKNQFFLNYLALTFIFITLNGVAQAQPGCSEWDWCRHHVEIKNSSCCEVEIWCQEIGCDGKDYFMGHLKSGKTFTGEPSAYGAKFKIAFNGHYQHEFPGLDIDGYCNSYNFEYKGSDNACSKPALHTDGDQTICKGQSVKICANGADGYWWSNGEDKRCITVSPDHTKTYTVTGKKNGCESSEEVTVNVKEKFHMPSSDDQTICEGQSVKICGEGADSYLWSNGKTTACITVSPNHTKTYEVVGTKDGCEDHDPIKVNVNGSLNLQTNGDQHICKGQSVELCADGADGYWWSNDKDKRCITVSPDHTKTYTVKGKKGGCEATKDVTVNVTGSFNLQTNNDQTICAGQSVELCADGADYYYWSNGSDHRCITVSPDHTKRL